MQNAIEFNHVWKKFRKGEKFNSIRDALPNFVRGLSRTREENELLDREFWATKDVHFSVKKGEVVGIIGANGAGKSTILKLLSGILVPSKGSLSIHGRLSALIEVTAGFHPELTGRENVYLNGTILGMKKKEIDAKFKQIVSFSGIEEFIDTPVKRYSSGMFSRLGFSVAAHVDPDVLLVDEVLSVGDIPFQSKCAEKMRELMKSGVTIIFVSHNLSLVQSLCQRLILLDQGKVLKEGPTDEVIPYYKDQIAHQHEQEVREKIESGQYQVKPTDTSDADILDVQFLNSSEGETDTFHVGDSITIDLRVIFHQPIEAPVFMVEILRSDGVLCCQVMTSREESKRTFHGKERARVVFDDISLNPGVYMLSLSVYDRDLIHPYVIRQKDVIKIEEDHQRAVHYGVFQPKAKWELKPE